MTERAASRPWSEHEDAQLRQAVAQYGENDNWKIIALSVPGRSNKACRKRWLHSLQPNVKKSAWTPSEDHLLLELYDKHGPKWSMIARQITGRTDDACSKRYREALDPSLKKDQWTPEEDEKLMEAYNRIGGKWGQVGQELQRSGLGCRNRWRLLERKKLNKANQALNSPLHALSTHELSPRIAPSPLVNFSHELASTEPAAAPEPLWPPYYPPEAYPMLTSSEEKNGIEMPFHVPTPPPLDIPNPEVAPFQFSSSSLSAALSDPPPRSRPLPPISAHNTPELSQDTLHDVDYQPTLSPLTHINVMPDMHDILMTVNPPAPPPMHLESPFNSQLPNLQVTISQPPYEQENFYGMPFPDGSFAFVSPITIPTEITQNDPFYEMWKPRHQEEFEFDSPRSLIDGLALGDINEGFSSSSSTPFLPTHALSPTASPNPASFNDLPSADFSPSGGSSLLFSTADRQNLGVQRPTRTISARKHKPSIKLPVPTRLSSSLPFTNDPNIKPYACGRPSCWPADQPTSTNCFVTSGELQDHAKDKHGDEDPSDKPFRCALAGCGKSWKSINGLQYHLQISTVHFAHAIQDKFSKQPSTPVQQMSMLSTESGEAEDSDRRYPCPTPGCYKAYRQPSGLRYHIKHGHPADLPTQLNFVPPALERQLPAKAKKMRPKPLHDGAGGFVMQMSPAAISSTL